MKYSRDIIYGRNPVREWIENGLPIHSIFLAYGTKGRAIHEIEFLAEKRKIQIKRLHSAKLDCIAGTEKHQNIIAQVDLPGYSDIESILKSSHIKNEAPLLAILDGVQDPQNLGAIIRSADAAGVHGIIIPKDNAAGMSAAVFKTSAGAATYVPVAQVTNIARTIEELKQNGLWITGTSEDAEKIYYNVDYVGPTVFILGNEGKGMRRLVREKCDNLIKIPLFGHVSSLNVSVTAGILFFEAKKQRQN